MVGELFSERVKLKVESATREERYDDLLESLHQMLLIVRENPTVELSEDERRLLSEAYEETMVNLLTKWRKTKTNHAVAHKAASDETRSVAEEMIHALLDNLIPQSTNYEAKVLYLKMYAALYLIHRLTFRLGDSYLYIFEISDASDKMEQKQNCNNAYKEGLNLAMFSLHPSHPVRLALSLNYSLFLYYFMDRIDKAIGFIKKTCSEAVATMEYVGEEMQKESSLLLQLLQDHYKEWSAK
ncbi:hypothetical protein Aperf_G00000098250 [Anoplocephala perfoliata]